MSIISGPPGPRPEQLLERISAPVLVLWGDRDTFTPIDGPVGRFFRRLPETRDRTEVQILPGVMPPSYSEHAVHAAEYVSQYSRTLESDYTLCATQAWGTARTTMCRRSLTTP